MTRPTDTPVIAGVLAEWAMTLSADDVPETVRETLGRIVLDAAGLMVATRHAGYVQACVESAAATGGTQTATAIGHAGRFTAGDAALISGTAAHGEDFDDTFEGTPVHVGAVLVPALLAVGETEVIGKPAGSDEGNGKATWPALLGLDASREKCADLLDSALDNLDGFGDKAEKLRELAKYIVQRAL